MKKITSLILCVLLLVSVVAISGCSKTDPTATNTQLVEVLSVENEGFVAKMGSDNCYVRYTNADQFVKPGDIVEITYYEYEHLAAISDREIGGYGWSSVINHAEKAVVK